MRLGARTAVATMVTLFIAATPAAAQPLDGYVQGRGEVLVPVMFEGTHHPAAAFNALKISVPLHSAFSRDGQVLHMFRTVAQVKRFIEEQTGKRLAVGSGGKVARLATRPVSAHNGSCYDHGSDQYAYWVDGYRCDGWPYLQTGPGVSYGNLAIIGWGDRFSSMRCTYNMTYTPACVMYDGWYWSGASHWVYAGLYGYEDDLGRVGLDNRITSIIQYIQQ